MRLARLFTALKNCLATKSCKARRGTQIDLSKDAKNGKGRSSYILIKESPPGKWVLL